MSSEIPVKAFAIAAYDAAKLVGENPADIFDDLQPSRARLIAIEIIRRVFPTALASLVRLNFCWSVSSKKADRVMENARCAKWWDEIGIERCAVDLRFALRLEGIGENIITVSAPRIDIERIASFYKPRKFVIVRGFVPKRPRNVTAMLMGDPGARGGIRVANGERSADVL